MIEPMGEREARVLHYMVANGGVISRAEALALGMTPATITRRVRSGHFRVGGKGIYVLPGILESERALLRAATVALDAVVSHESAARVHSVEGLDPRRVTVTVPVRRSNRFNGVIVHQLTDLTEEETTSVDGLPVTDPGRTVIDLAAVLPPRLLAEVLDQTVRMKLATYELVADRLEAKARRGKPGVVILRSILEGRLGGVYVSESTLETRLLRLLDQGGLPRPDPQYRPDWLRHINGRVDLAYVAEEVIVEGDSQRWHGSPDAFQLDRRRDNLAQLAGWLILRFTWEDITQRPSYVVATVRQALSMRSVDQ